MYLEVSRVLRPGGILIVTMIPPLIGLLVHKLAWWYADQVERCMGQHERYGLTTQEVMGLAHACGFTLRKTEKFVARMNNLYVFEKS